MSINFPLLYFHKRCRQCLKKLKKNTLYILKATLEKGTAIIVIKGDVHKTQ